MSHTAGNDAKRKLLLVLIFAPGLLLIFFWLGNTYYTPEDKVVEPPQAYVRLGEKIEREDNWFRVYRGQQLFLDRIDLGNNLAVAEPGRVFIGLGLASGTGGYGGEVEMIDSRGGAYQPLKIKRELVAISFGFSGDSYPLYLFKVDSRAENYFFVLGNDGQGAWMVPNTYSKGAENGI